MVCSVIVYCIICFPFFFVHTPLDQRSTYVNKKLARPRQWGYIRHMKDGKKITIRVDPDIYAEQQAAILASGRDVSEVVREALAKAANDAKQIEGATG